MSIEKVDSFKGISMNYLEKSVDFPDCYNVYFQLSPKKWSYCHKDFVHNVKSDYGKFDSNITMSVSIRCQDSSDYSIDRHFYKFDNKKFNMKGQYIKYLEEILETSNSDNIDPNGSCVDYGFSQEANSIHKSHTLIGVEDSLLLEYLISEFNSKIYKQLFPKSISRLMKMTRYTRQSDGVIGEDFGTTYEDLIADETSDVRFGIKRLQDENKKLKQDVAFHKFVSIGTLVLYGGAIIFIWLYRMGVI
jgi:hypothetical protein